MLVVGLVSAGIGKGLSLTAGQRRKPRRRTTSSSKVDSTATNVRRLTWNTYQHNPIHIPAWFNLLICLVSFTYLFGFIHIPLYFMRNMVIDPGFLHSSSENRGGWFLSVQSEKLFREYLLKSISCALWWE